MTNTTTITTTIALPSYVVRNEKGQVDQKMTLDKFTTDLSRYCAAAETEHVVLAEKVNETFDKFKGAKLNMPALVSLTLQALSVTPENYKIMTEKVQDFVRANAGERGKAPFNIAKGKGGGVSRWADMPLSEKEVAAIKVAAEAAAKEAAAKPLELSSAPAASADASEDESDEDESDEENDSDESEDDDQPSA